jgi:aldose 1-epimerase
MTLNKSAHGTTKSGHAADLYTLTNASGAHVKISTYGGTITHVMVPDAQGQLGDVVLGFDDLAAYEERSPFFGCIAGRFANRIAKGRFSLDGQNYKLAVNNGPNHLHGGKVGFDKAVWKAEAVTNTHGVGIALSHSSPAGDEGYPGALSSTVTYTWNNDNELRIHYKATTDAPTVLNLTNHSYFNLAGQGNVLQHDLQLECDAFTPTDSVAIPTGEIRPTAGTPFDFSQPHTIGERINAAEQQIQFGGGYDHNFVINGRPGHLRRCATVHEGTTSRVLEVETTEPGVQLYTGNFLDGLKGKGGAVYRKRDGFCLETQHYPDSPNHPTFPTTVLRPGETYESTTVFRFSVRK